MQILAPFWMCSKTETDEFAGLFLGEIHTGLFAPDAVHVLLENGRTRNTWSKRVTSRHGKAFLVQGGFTWIELHLEAPRRTRVNLWSRFSRKQCALSHSCWSWPFRIARKINITTSNEMKRGNDYLSENAAMIKDMWFLLKIALFASRCGNRHSSWNCWMNVFQRLFWCRQN